MNAPILSPDSPNWFSYVSEAKRISDADNIDWNESAEVLVVGFGAAGASAALEARSRGADVLAVDRFNGGGASAISGGVYYGGGTHIQQKAGIEDSAEELYNYLKLETEGVVKDSTLRHFCDENANNLKWLEDHGVVFNSTLYDKKTVYPPDGYFLYYAGNELLERYRAHAKPAPRGHRAVGKGIFCGKYFYTPLKNSALANGVRLKTHCAVTRLVLNTKGEVLGVEARQIPEDTRAWRKHNRLITWFNKLLRFDKNTSLAAARRLEAMEERHGESLFIRARRGVVLTTGSFSYNRSMVREYAAGYEGAMPVGSAGCDGSGVRLGQTAGGVTAQMHNVSAWRWISPPLSFIEGIVVNRHGKRFVEEDAYSGRVGERIGEGSDHTAYLIIDRKSYRAAWKEALAIKNARWWVEGLPIFRTLLFNCKKAKTIAAAAGIYNLPAEQLQQTVTEYNANAARGEDPVGKTRPYLRPLTAAPFYVVDISTANQITLCPTIPMGGLRVNEETGNVLREDGSDIKGLYAAGRTAVGIPSNFYVSGTSLADCVFSGRRAGANAAQSS